MYSAQNLIWDGQIKLSTNTSYFLCRISRFLWALPILFLIYFLQNILYMAFSEFAIKNKCLTIHVIFIALFWEYFKIFVCNTRCFQFAERKIISPKIIKLERSYFCHQIKPKKTFTCRAKFFSQIHESIISQSFKQNGTLIFTLLYAFWKSFSLK